MVKLAFASADTERVVEAVRKAAPIEAGCFCLVRAMSTATGCRLVASQPYFPSAREWVRAGTDQLQPTTQLLSKMAQLASAAEAGLLFIHSHPRPTQPTGFSQTDVGALARLEKVIPTLIHGPFVAVVIGPQGWVGAAYLGGKWEKLDRITSSGRRFEILSPIVLSKGEAEIDDRQLRALGDTHKILRALDIGIVGCGGLGSPLAETLVRMGVRSATLVDFDRVDTPSNVRRIFGASMRHLMAQPLPSKVSVVSELCNFPGLSCVVRSVEGDVRHRAVFAAVADCDVILCATDSHSSRNILNAAAYALHVPLIDGGVRVGVRHSTLLDRFLCEVRLCAPGLPCLWCRETLSAERIREENLPTDERAQLQKQGYIAGSADGPAPSVTALTVVGAGLMASRLVGMLSEKADTLPDSMLIDALSGDSFPRTKKADRTSCPVCEHLFGSATIPYF